MASSAVAAGDPLTAERILLAYEFDRLDDMVGLHSFDDTVLFGYALKLKLLERACSFEKKKGEKEFNDILKGLEDQVMSL